MTHYGDKFCAICNYELDFIKEYGDGYTEPKEEVYICPNCGCQHIWREDTGWEYDDSDVNWRNVP